MRVRVYVRVCVVRKVCRYVLYRHSVVVVVVVVVHRHPYKKIKAPCLPFSEYPSLSLALNFPPSYHDDYSRCYITAAAANSGRFVFSK